MNPRAIIVGVLAIALAALAVVLTRSWLSSSQQPTTTVQAPTGPEIMVARANMPRGTIITPEHFQYVMWTGPQVNPAYIVRESDRAKNVLGMTVRYEMVAGEPVLMSKLVKPGEEGPIGIALKPGMRALALGVNRTSGLSGLPKPGDYVDVIYVNNVADIDGNARRVATTVLTNARVLGVDMRVTDEAVASDNPKTVTVEVTPADAQRLALMQSTGDFTLTIRSLAADSGDNGDSTVPPYSTASDLNSLVDPLELDEDSGRIAISRGNSTVEQRTREEGDNQ